MRQDVLPDRSLIVVVAIIALRLARLFVHGIVKTLLDREATEGTAQELSAVELKKRMDTLDALGAQRRSSSSSWSIAGLMILGQLGLDIGPAVAGLGVVGIAVGFGAQSLVRDYLNGVADPRSRTSSRKGDVVRLAGVSGTVEDFTLRRTTLRDLDGVVHTVPNGEIKVASQPDPGLVADQPGRDGRLRHRHRQGDRGRRRGRRARWPPTRSGSGASSRRRGSSASRRSARRASRSRSSARSGPPTSGPPPASFRKRLLAAFRENGIEIPRPAARRSLTRAAGRRRPRPPVDPGPADRTTTLTPDETASAHREPARPARPAARCDCA